MLALLGCQYWRCIVLRSNIIHTLVGFVNANDMARTEGRKEGVESPSLTKETRREFDNLSSEVPRRYQKGNRVRCRVSIGQYLTPFAIPDPTVLNTRHHRRKVP